MIVIIIIVVVLLLFLLLIYFITIKLVLKKIVEKDMYASNIFFMKENKCQQFCDSSVEFLQLIHEG